MRNKAKRDIERTPSPLFCLKEQMDYDKSLVTRLCDIKRKYKTKLEETVGLFSNRVIQLKVLLKCLNCCFKVDISDTLMVYWSISLCKYTMCSVPLHDLIHYYNVVRLKLMYIARAPIISIKISRIT